MQIQKKFKATSVAAGASRIYGQASLATDIHSTYDEMSTAEVHTIGITSSGAATATITFNMGSGYGATQTLTLGAAGSISQPYYHPGAVAVKVEVSTTGCTVDFDSREA